MSLLSAIVIGVVGGLAVGLGAISAIHRCFWGHWRFWRLEKKEK